jgi:excinuclease UvrABC nuclease subunit
MGYDSQKYKEWYYSNGNGARKTAYQRKRRAENPQHERNLALARKIPSVYIAYGIDDTIIYVGRSAVWPKRRFLHQKESVWFKEVNRWEVIPQPTFGDSLVAEAVLIRDNQPKYNKEGVIK